MNIFLHLYLRNYEMTKVGNLQNITKSLFYLRIKFKDISTYVYNDSI
jgi:hypothetical protein